MVGRVLGGGRERTGGWAIGSGSGRHSGRSVHKAVAGTGRLCSVYEAIQAGGHRSRGWQGGEGGRKESLVAESPTEPQCHTPETARPARRTGR